MTQLRLEKVSADSYQDNTQPDKPRRWQRVLGPLELQLSDVKAGAGFRIDLPELPEYRRDYSLVAKLLKRPVSEPRNSCQQFLSLTAVGTIPSWSGRLRMINPTEGDRDEFREVRVAIHGWKDPAADAPETWSGLVGTWCHDDGQREHFGAEEPRLRLDLRAPDSVLRPLWSEFVHGRPFGQATLVVLVETFVEEWRLQDAQREVWSGIVAHGFERSFHGSALAKEVRVQFAPQNPVRPASERAGSDAV